MDVSVIIPAHNAAATVARAIGSLTGQVHRNWEALVVDDGSTDDTASIVEDLARRDPRVRLLRQGKAGVGAARNRGLHCARFDWVLFLDADDILLPPALSRLTAELRGSPSLDAICCGWRTISPSGDVREWWPRAEADLFPWLARSGAMAINSCLVRRSRVMDAGGFDESMPLCEDWDLWQRIARSGAGFGCVREILAACYLHVGSIAADPAKFLHYGSLVVRNGHAPDPRVRNPRPRHENGRPRHELQGALNLIACYSAALLVGRGMDTAPALNAIQPSPGEMPVDASWLFDYVLLPDCSPVERWRELWLQLGQRIENLLEDIERRSACPHFARRSLRNLEALIAAACAGPEPMVIGGTIAWRCDAARPLPEIAVPAECQRLWCAVDFDGVSLGSVELPVLRGKLSRYVLADAIAHEYAWQILRQFFERTLYRSLVLSPQPDAAHVYRGAARIGKIPADSSLHDCVAWTCLLQELWQRPAWTGDAFYDPDCPEPVAGRTELPAGRLSIEVGEDLPDVAVSGGELEIECRVGGVPVKLLRLPVANGSVRGSEIRVAVLNGMGYELCRAAVREALLFDGETGERSLRERLDARVPSNGAGGRAVALSRALRQEQPDLVLGPRTDVRPVVTSFRRFTLPRSAAEIVRRSSTERQASVRLARWPRPIRNAVRSPEFPASVHLSETGGGQSQPLVREHDAHLFESWFASRNDPWGYTNAYERRKYEQTLSLLPDGKLGRVLELACAEGHFTPMLVPRAREIVAADISFIALDRAAQRCAGAENVRFLCLDMARDPIPGEFDLIICSEVLYYLESEDVLRTVARKLASALVPGGRLVMAHANIAGEEPGKPGFAWDAPWGAPRIGQVFAATPGLRLARELRTDLYRIHDFERSDRPADQSPDIISASHAEPLPERIARTVDWTGSKRVTKDEAHFRYANRLPVLMYHRIGTSRCQAQAPYCVAPKLFQRQMQYLSEAGFRTIALDTWARVAEARGSLPGRRVVLTFDDAFLDFATEAWPVLQRFGFSAYVFAVTGAAGRVSHWDPPDFEKAPLLGWNDMRRLESEGVRFGAHTVRHRPLDALSLDEAGEELARSRLDLEDKLGVAVDTVAYPFGACDRSIEHLAGGCGYSFGLTTQPEVAHFRHSLLALPRVMVNGTDDLPAFIASLGI